MSLTLGEAVHKLTSPHIHDGNIRPSLLDELRNRTTPGQDAGAGTGTDEPKIPIAVGTVDLSMLIEKEARDELWAWKHFTIAGDLKYTIQAYENPTGAWANDWEKYFTRLTNKWIRQINQHLRPTKPRKKLMQPCPACGVKLAGEERKPVLTLNCWDDAEEMMKPQEWDVVCESCGAEWRGDELTWLQKSFAA